VRLPVRAATLGRHLEGAVVLAFYSFAAAGRIEIDLDSKTIPPEVSWIDAFRPDTREITFLERALGIEVPTLAELSDIESSSRLYEDRDRLFLTTPALYRTVSGMPRTTLIGFVLSKDILLTVRFKPLKAFEQLSDHRAKQHIPLPGGAGAFITVFEAIIERVADELEYIGADLDALSEAIFGGDSTTKREERPQHYGDHLRHVLRKIGRTGDHVGKISDALLGMDRMIPFVTTNAAEYLSSDMKSKLKILHRDILSLDDYEAHLTAKIQFLLDATLGLTNIDQNEIFRILTAVSVVGIPPTFITSLYGMNFKLMPELDWTYGYGFALGLIALSAILPILWFKRKGWW
jgi:magnesium transporter